MKIRNILLSALVSSAHAVGMFALKSEFDIKKHTSDNQMLNLAELNEDSPYYECEFSVKVEDDSFAVVDLPKEQGYKFNLEHIDYAHDGCENAKMRIAMAKFRDDPLS